jgi:hypothetical protein
MLANTARFLKSEHLRKVDNIQNHLNSVTLNFKDVDLESEWRMIEINKNRIALSLGATFCLIQDVVWTMILQETALRGKIIRLVLDAIQFLSYYQMYYCRKAQDYNSF